MIYDWLPSRRKKIENGTLYPDIYQYDEVSHKLRTIFARTFRKANFPIEVVIQIIEVICDEWAINLENCLGYGNSTFDDIENFILNFQNDEKEIFLDLLALHFRYLHHTEKQDTIKELNQRMLENGFGYQFEKGTLIRIDSLPMHKNVVKPTLELLQDSRFENANVEYRQAFDDYNHRRYEGMFVNLCKSVESTIKIICDINSFGLSDFHSLKPLISRLIKNNFLPQYNEKPIEGLDNMLRTIGNIRNENGGHGAGVEKRKIDQSLITYAMHSTTATLLFLLQRQKEWESK